MELVEQIKRVNTLLQRISFKLFNTRFNIRVCPDAKLGGRLYLQVHYDALCTQTHKLESWSGRKWYLSEHMLDDEIIKTCFAACKAASEHEVMEAFKIDGIVLFNPHTSFEELLKVSHKEVKRIRENAQTQEEANQVSQKTEEGLCQIR